MPNRRSLVAALALLACSSPSERSSDDQPATKVDAKVEPEVEAPPPAEPPGEANTKPDPLDYSSFGMPVPGSWSADEFTLARKAIGAIAKQDPKLLPRDDTPTFAALTDVDHLSQLAAAISPEQLAGLSLSLAMIHMVYGDQIRRDPEFEREHLILGAALLAVTSKLPTTVVRTEAEAAALRAEPARLEGLLRYRHGINEIVETIVSFEPKSTLDYAFACTQLARIIDDAAPLMLADERAAARTRLEACASAGADPKVVEQLERALAEDAPTAALVTALLPEHREFAAAQ